MSEQQLKYFTSW